MSEAASSQSSLQNRKREAITSDFLKIELTRIFSKVEIEKSKYYAYRMNKFLEIPLDAVYKDPSIIKLTQNKAIINESLSKVLYVTLNSDRKIISLNYTFNKNELYVPQKQLVEQDKSIVSLKDHHKEIKRITKTSDTFVITLESRESVQAVKERLQSQNIKAYDEKGKFYQDLIENIDKQKSIPTISNRTLVQSKPKESFIGYHRGLLQGFMNQTIPPVSPSAQYLNHLQFLQIMDPNFLRMSKVVDSLTYPQQQPQQTNSQRKKTLKTETPKITASTATPGYRRKRLLSQGQFNQDQNNSLNPNKQQPGETSSSKEEIIYEKKKNNYNIAHMKSPKQVQFRDQNTQAKNRIQMQKVSSNSQFDRLDQDISDQQSNESFEINKKNISKLKASKSSDLLKDAIHFGEQYTDDKRESLLSEDANSNSTQHVDISECSFTPKITLLQMEINQNQDDSDTEQDQEDINEKEKFHPQTTDSFRPKNYQKLEQIDDLEI